jgi:hypothetical protein
MNRALLASNRHTAITVAMIATVAVLGATQATPRMGPGGSHVAQYLVVIALECLWLRYIHVGLRAQGHSLSDLTGKSWGSRSITLDILFGALGFAAANLVAASLKVALGNTDANTAFLLPRGLADSTLWVLLSCTAGVSEEIVFRGYLQQQFSRLTRSVSAGIALQTLLFGLVHAYQGPASIAITGSYGLMLGILAWWRGNVRAGVLAHAATDIVGGLTRF